MTAMSPGANREVPIPPMLCDASAHRLPRGSRQGVGARLPNAYGHRLNVPVDEFPSSSP